MHYMYILRKVWLDWFDMHTTTPQVRVSYEDIVLHPRTVFETFMVTLIRRHRTGVHRLTQHMCTHYNNVPSVARTST